MQFWYLVLYIKIYHYSSLSKSYSIIYLLSQPFSGLPEFSGVNIDLAFQQRGGTVCICKQDALKVLSWEAAEDIA